MIDLLLEEDQRTPESVRRVLARLDPWAATAIQALATLYTNLSQTIGAATTHRRDEAALAGFAQTLGVTNDRLRELIGSGSEDRLVSKARAVYVPYHARDVGALLYTICGRYFRWMATDLLRGRVTSAIGYVRLQAEAVALVHLLLNQPLEADAWYAAGVGGDGRAFYRRTQRQVQAFMKDLGLAPAYDWGSEQALHVRVFPVLRAHVLENTDDDRRYLWLRDHELDEDAPERFLQSFVLILAAQVHVLRGLRLGRPDVDTQDFAGQLGAFAVRVKDLSVKLGLEPTPR